MFSGKTRLIKGLGVISKSIDSQEADAWEAIASVERFIVINKKTLMKHPGLLKNIEEQYQNLLKIFSDNLGQVSRGLFTNIEELDNTYTDLRSPLCHQRCVNASENIAMKIIDEILSKSNINERTLVVWRYIVIAKMRLDEGDYQSAEFIVSALMSSPVNMDRLKATYAGLPFDIIKLIKSLERIALKPDSHVMTYRTKPVIPSLARIKKLMTFANSEQVSESKRNEIKNMLATLQTEVKNQEEIINESHLVFFSFDQVKKHPDVSLDEFNKHKYKKSINKVEKRGEITAGATLFNDQFKFLPEMNLKIQIDEKIDTFLKLRSLLDKIMALYTKISLLLDELELLQESQPRNKKGELKRKQLAEINKELSGLKHQIETRMPILDYDHLMEYLRQKAEFGTAKNHPFHHTFKRWRDRESLADKLEQLIDLLALAYGYQKISCVLDRKCEKLNKKYKELSVYDPGESESKALASGDENSAISEKCEEDILFISDDKITDLPPFESGSTLEKEIPQPVSGAIIMECENEPAVEKIQNDVASDENKYNHISQGLRARVALFEKAATVENILQREQIHQTESKDVKSLIRLFDNKTVDGNPEENKSPLLFTYSV